jgi:hypothetical protein
MVALSALWLPVVLSAVAVFIASSLIHMVIGWHNSDYGKLPNEDAIRDAMRDGNVEPGDYYFPRADDLKDNMSEAMQAKFAAGPSGKMTVFPKGPVNMGKNLLHWFFYCVVIGLFAGYVGSATLAAGTDYLNVFQVVGTAAILGYAGGAWQAVIWAGRKPMSALKDLADGVIYGLLTAGVFGWLWP